MRRIKESFAIPFHVNTYMMFNTLFSFYRKKIHNVDRINKIYL